MGFGIQGESWNQSPDLEAQLYALALWELVNSIL
jgi:hypothetical protein